MISVLVTLGVFWLAAGNLMHSAESKLPGGNHEQFGTIGESLWASVVVLTTLPSLEVVPGALAGRVVAGFIALLGIGLFALPAGILTSNFLDAYQQAREGANGETPTCRLQFPPDGSYPITPGKGLGEERSPTTHLAEVADGRAPDEPDSPEKRR